MVITVVQALERFMPRQTTPSQSTLQSLRKYKPISYAAYMDWIAVLICKPRTMLITFAFTAIAVGLIVGITYGPASSAFLALWLGKAGFTANVTLGVAYGLGVFAAINVALFLYGAYHNIAKLFSKHPPLNQHLFWPPTSEATS